MEATAVLCHGLSDNLHIGRHSFHVVDLNHCDYISLRHRSHPFHCPAIGHRGKPAANQDANGRRWHTCTTVRRLSGDAPPLAVSAPPLHDRAIRSLKSPQVPYRSPSYWTTWLAVSHQSFNHSMGTHSPSGASPQAIRESSICWSHLLW